MSANFNASAGVLLKDKGFIFGSIDGAIEFPKDIKFPHYQFSKIILSDFRLSYQPVFSGEENSPLTEDIDDIKVLKLSHNQKYFLTKSIDHQLRLSIQCALQLETGRLLYYLESPESRKHNPFRQSETRKIQTVYSCCVQRGTECHIRRTHHRCHNRTSGMAQFLGYIMLYSARDTLAFYHTRIIYFKKTEKISDEKTQFFINTAHDLRTPLTLIKAPLEELSEKSTVDGKRTQLYENCSEKCGRFVTF